MNATSATPAVITVEKLGFTFVGHETPTLSDVSFQLDAGTWTLVTGRTGSGKSTLLRALAGLVPRHTAGVMTGSVQTIVRALADARGLPPPGVRGGPAVQLLLQAADDQLCATTVAAEVAFGLENLALPADEIAARVHTSLERFGLAGMEAMPTQHLSGGQKQRLLLAAVMAMRPQVLLLDEPLSQLDSFAATELLNELERLRTEGVCIVLVEHRLDDVLPRVDRLLLLDGGRLVGDAAANDAEAVEAALVKGGLEAPEAWKVARAAEGFARTACETAFVDNSLRELKSDSRSESATILQFSATTFSFPGAAAPLWRDVAFTLSDGDRVAVVGPNGAGKSTLLNVVAEQAARDRQTSVGLVLQNPDLMLFCDSVADELAYGPRELGLDSDTIRARVASAADALTLNDLLAEPPQSLSQGQRLRTAVAATLALAPHVLLLDEPTTGQDQRQVTRVFAALSDAVTQAEGPLADVRAMLFSTHDLRFVAQFANRVLVLAEGRLLADYSPAALLADDDMLVRARLRRPPLLELRQQLGLHGLTANEMLKELRP